MAPNDSDFRILVIDDNVAIHSDFKKILSEETDSEFNALSLKMFGKQTDDISLPKFEIHAASQGQEGVALIKKALEEGRPYSLAFVDIRMPPGWDGIETIKRIWALDKDIQIVICTAYSDYSWEETVSHLGKTDNLLILKKPFDNVSVRQLACALTKKWELLKNSRAYTHMLQQEVADRTLSLEKSLSLIKSTFESSNNGILVINNEGQVVDYNKKLKDILSISEEILTSGSEVKIFDNIAKKSFSANDVFKALQSFHEIPSEVRIDNIKFKNGKILECYSQPHRLNGEIVGRILDFRDITARAKLEEKLQFQATHDSLTGLANRVQLLEHMRIQMDKAEKNHTKLLIVFLDFDRFKLINDSLSHEIGDLLLQTAASRLQSILGKNDLLSRLGGDEFVFVFPDINKDEEIYSKIKNLLHIFEEPFVLGKRRVVLTASLGVSIFPDDGTSASILLRNADAAMYRAKANKGNNFRFYTPEMNKESLAALDQEVELRNAIENKEFFLCYQPQVDLMEEKLVAVEALIRWQHPTKGTLLPIDFIQTAEETGLITQIGEWVLRTACQQAKTWQKVGLPSIRVAVNITAEQFKLQNMVKVVETILNETQLDPKYLELELTENVIISNPEIIRIVRKLKKLGVSVAIDDFGTGYSSLSYLHKIPLDRLKIDASFIRHIQSPTDDEAIIRAVIAMAKNLNLEVLAEGVETFNQLQFLKKYECGDVQGFYFSKPLNSNELEKILQNPNELKEMTKQVLPDS